LGLLVTTTLEVVPFRAYAPFPTFLTFFKCFLGVVFCEAVQHRLRFCLAQVRQNGGLSVVSSTRETEKSRVGGDDNHVVFGKKKKSLVKKKV
jgi:hypothetical protein